MKKMLTVLLAALLLLCSCNGQGETSSSGNTPAAEASTDENFIREIEGVKYLDVKAAAKATDTLKNKADPLFPEDAEGYYIERGVYSVSADVMRRIIKKPFAGNGAIDWNGYLPVTLGGNEDVFDGDLPVSKIGDPLYELMCLPNEQSGLFEDFGQRYNAAKLYPLTDEYANAIPIGQICWDTDKEIPDDAEITLCFGKITLCARTKDSDGWFIASQTDCKPCNIYPFPPGLDNEESPVTSIRKSDLDVQWVDDHYEVKVTAADFNGDLFNDERVTDGILHFWGKFFYFDKGSDVLGIASSYVVWVKEPEWSGYLTADIGADIRNEDKTYCQQAFTGINYIITDQPRLIIGHNVGPKEYDEVMDSAKVLELVEWDKYQE